MSIKKSAENNKNEKMKRVKMSIEDILTLDNEILNEAPEVKNLLNQAIQEIEKIKFKNINKQFLSGKIYSAEEILDVIKETSGYTKWTLSVVEDLGEKDFDYLKEKYNVDFSEKKLNIYRFSRNTQNRDALCAIFVKSLPGLFEVELHTNRVGYGMDGLVSIEEFAENIGVESDN